jgi:hypothetical protein
VFRRHPEFIISSAEMTDWQMLIEKWPGDKNNFPRFVNNDQPDRGPRQFTTTLKYLRASRGRFTFDDHEVPWSVDGPNLEFDLTNLPQYHGTAKFHGGTIKIQNHLPMWGDFNAKFVLDGPRVHLPRIDINTDGAETTASGDVDFSHWPDMRYDVKSRVHFPRMRSSSPTRSGHFAPATLISPASFRSAGGHNLSGTFSSQTAGVHRAAVPGPHGTLQWNEHAFDVWNAGSKFEGGDAKFSYSMPFGVRSRRRSGSSSRSREPISRPSRIPALPPNGLRFAAPPTGCVSRVAVREIPGAPRRRGLRRARRQADAHDLVARDGECRGRGPHPA